MREMYLVEDADLATRTAASIKFIMDAKEFLNNTLVKDGLAYSEMDQKKVQAAIDKIRSGEFEFEEWVTPLEFLEMLKEPLTESDLDGIELEEADFDIIEETDNESISYTPEIEF